MHAHACLHQRRESVVVGVPPAGCHCHFELTHLHTWNWELQRRRARSVCYTVVGRRQGFESEPSALPSEACSSVGQSLSVLSTSVDDSRFPNPESSAVTASLHSRNDSVISNRSRSPADQPSEEFALRRRRVCVIAGLRVSGMPASTGRREQSVCFFAGKRGPASECRVSRAGAGRGAARQTGRGAELTLRLACGFAVAGRWSGALAAERRSAEQAHATRRADGTRCPTACMPLGRVGVRRRVGHVQL